MKIKNARWPVKEVESHCVQWDDGERSVVFLTRIGPANTFLITFRSSDDVARNIQCTGVELGALRDLIEHTFPFTEMVDL